MSVSPPRVAILDYGAGNLRSAERGLLRAGAQAFVTSDAAAAAAAHAIVVPGVGHFGTCVRNLVAAGLDGLVRDAAAAGRPLLGICVGMQLLFEGSDEAGEPGLGVLPGRVVRLSGDVRIPHMGWNVVTPVDESDPLMEGVGGRHVYFVHSYHADSATSSHVVATTTHGTTFPSLVRSGSVVGTQFHPEKSAATGARLLANWVAALRVPAAA